MGMIDLVYSYVFEENTYDGESDFIAEVNLVDEAVDQDAMLNIEVYPYPTVMHYLSFERYSYVDWVADVGGFYTLVIAAFFILTSRIAKLANRRENFHLQQDFSNDCSMQIFQTRYFSPQPPFLQK